MVGARREARARFLEGRGAVTEEDAGVGVELGAEEGG